MSVGTPVTGHLSRVKADITTRLASSRLPMLIFESQLTQLSIKKDMIALKQIRKVIDDQVPNRNLQSNKILLLRDQWLSQCERVCLLRMRVADYFDIITYLMSKLEKAANLKQASETKDQKKKKHSIYKHSWLHRLIFRGDYYHIEGQQSASFYRKPYEMPIESLSTVTRDILGFTNNILLRKDNVKKIAQLFVPAYSSLKVKSIKQIDIKDLIAQLSCVLIIVFLIEGLPDGIVQLLESQVMIQVNKGQSFKLCGGDDSIKIKKTKVENKFLKFIVRDVIPVQIHDDVFLSPFEILNLVLTITINSISVPKSATIQQGFKTQISFNNMRNPEAMSVSFVSSDSRLGVYELAENKMAHYPSNLASYNQVKDQLEDYIQGKKDQTSLKIEPKKSRKINITPISRKPEQRLELVLHQSSKQLPEKIKYFQYSHFVVPLYKGPGNAWATIFIPIMMLAFLSLSLFFYKATPTEKIGTVATIVLGFIALIPSIKDELPPCNKTTISEIIVYIEAINCMLSLNDNTVNFRRQWLLENKLFLFSLLIHLLCIGLAFLLLILHKVSWQPSYNTNEKPKQLSPIDDQKSWSNPYCDEYFLEYNKNHSIKVEKYSP